MSNVPAFALVEPTDWHFRSLGDVAEASRRANEYARRNGTLEGAEYQIEEFVRQWVLRFLIEEYAYPLEWLGERIIIEEPVRGGNRVWSADRRACAATRSDPGGRRMR